MTSDEAFEREVIGMLIVDDLLRQNSLPDDRAFVESLNLRLGAEGERNGFLSRFTQFFNDRVSPVRRGTPFHAVFGVITAAAIVICTLSAALLGYYWRGASPRPLESSALVAPKAEIEPELEFTPGLRTETQAVAILTRMVNVRWDAGEVSLNEGSALGRGPLRIAFGLIQIEFFSGASVIIEGPCDLELLSPYKAVCHRGKLRAHVPPHAHGFTIAAPGVDAVDLGTEFAMSIDEQGRGQVHVVEGELELRGAGAAGVERGEAPHRPAEAPTLGCLACSRRSWRTQPISSIVRNSFDLSKRTSAVVTTGGSRTVGRSATILPPSCTIASRMTAPGNVRCGASRAKATGP